MNNKQVFLYLVEGKEQEYFKVHQLPQGDPKGIRHGGGGQGVKGLGGFLFCKFNNCSLGRFAVVSYVGTKPAGYTPSA